LRRILISESLVSDHTIRDPSVTNAHSDTTLENILTSLYKLFASLQQHHIMGLEERASAMIGISAAYLVIAWIAFSLRVVVKGYIMRSFALDDWLMVVAMVRI
jgi:hypothetical protein